VLPIRLDAWTSILAAAAPPLFTGFAGTLNANGRATATLDLRSIPIPPEVLGLRWTMAAFGVDGGGCFGGGPAEFEIVP
jgi:hypothetical protein